MKKFPSRRKALSPTTERKDAHLMMTTSEVEYTIVPMERWSAPGSDMIIIILIKLFNDKAINVLLNFFNIIYEKVEISTEGLTSAFVLIPEKPNSRECTYEPHSGVISFN